ncbi:HAD hydrolase-like protein [Sphaerisporangium fuscum]
MLQALDQLAAEPGQTVLVGDSVTDVEAGRPVESS